MNDGKGFCFPWSVPDLHPHHIQSLCQHAPEMLVSQGGNHPLFHPPQCMLSAAVNCECKRWSNHLTTASWRHTFFFSSCFLPRVGEEPAGEGSAGQDCVVMSVATSTHTGPYMCRPRVAFSLPQVLLSSHSSGRRGAPSLQSECQCKR